MRRVKLYDTLSREVRLFVPLHPPKVGLFVCGLTPYAEAHIGHAKAFVTFDVLARALRHWGYRVFYLQNVTNLDDRLIERGAAEGVDPLVLAERHFAEYRRAMDELAVRSVNYYPFATDYVPEIVRQIGSLIERKMAYESDGSVYFDVGKFPSYGALSGQRTEALRPGARVEVDPRKRSPEDFVIWKAATPGEPTWESPWGPGRPGWHIEDTAITVQLLGARYDIHGGGLDLKFPHHEAEIALAESATGEAPFVSVWMHAGLLTFGGEKMSKSLGNVVSLSATIEKFGPMPLRFFFLNAHYRSPLDFIEGKSLEESQEAYARLEGPYRRLTERLSAAPEEPEGEPLDEATARSASETVEALEDLLADDFNTREAIARLFTWGRSVNDTLSAHPTLQREALESLAAPYRWAEEVLGLFEDLRGAGAMTALDGVVRSALDARRRARARGDYAEADRIRAELLAAGVQLEDSGPTTTWRLASEGSG